MIGIAIITFCLLFVFMVGLYEKEKHSILDNVSTIDTIAPIANEQKKQAITEHILSVTNEYKEKKQVTEEEIKLFKQEK